MKSLAQEAVEPEIAHAYSGSAPHKWITPLAGYLQANHMSRLGIANTMGVSRWYNGTQFRRHDRWRRAMYAQQLEALLEENGRPAHTPVTMGDGWAIDTSQSLPHLDAVLAAGDKIFAERAGVRGSTDSYRSYFQDVWLDRDATDFPGILDFATSSQLLASVAEYLKCIPALSATLPRGIRMVESNAAFDDYPDRWKDSQLYHIDYYSLPNVYVIVLLKDATPDSGPFTFLSRSTSQRAMNTLGYWKRRRGYRVSDEDIYSVVDRKEVVEFAYPRGSVLFFESSGCFHYGSRNAVNPRYQLMLGYTGAIRTDLSEYVMGSYVYPIRPSDSKLRRMVLDRNMLE